MTVVILAPHLEYPPRNGGDIYIERLGKYLSRPRDEVVILAVRTLTYYANGIMIRQEQYQNSFRSKTWSAIRAVAMGSHYLSEKFLTPTYRAKVFDVISNYPNSLVVCSYILTAKLLDKSQGPAVILTQNDEISWFQNLRRFSKNPFQKLTAFFSERWVTRFLREHEQDYIYAHITESDYAGYKQLIPKHRALVVPAGVDIEPLPLTPAWDGKTRLLFCGSLSVKMNYDALIFFKERFWRLIKNQMGEQVEMLVAGSLPTSAVQQLCREQQWKLHPDLPNEALREIFGQANFSVLPFPYTTGAKLKLLNSLAAGLPVMATTNMNTLPEQDFLPNLYSDDPQTWLEHLKKFSQDSLRPESRASCQKYASRYGWETVVGKMDKDLEQMRL